MYFGAEEKMTTQDILLRIGHFSELDLLLFEKFSQRLSFQKEDIVLHESQVCQSAFFILSGSFVAYEKEESADKIIDLHVAGEWMFNQQSLSAQSPSKSIIKAFSPAEVLELSLSNLHHLIACSQAFLQLGSIFSQTNHRVHLFDQALNPAQKYEYILKAKPQLLQAFPLKMIASYLKISPETLSRVRAQSGIS